MPTALREEGGSNQQRACEELQLDCFFSEGSAKVYEQPCACQLVFFSEGSAEVYEQPCACQLPFF